MHPLHLPRVLIGVLGFVGLVPVVSWYLTQSPGFQALSLEAQLLAGFAVPAIGLLFIASHLQPGA